MTEPTLESLDQLARRIEEKTKELRRLMEKPPCLHEVEHGYCTADPACNE